MRDFYHFSFPFMGWGPMLMKLYFCSSCGDPLESELQFILDSNHSSSSKPVPQSSSLFTLTQGGETYFPSSLHSFPLFFFFQFALTRKIRTIEHWYVWREMQSCLNHGLSTFLSFSLYPSFHLWQHFQMLKGGDLIRIIEFSVFVELFFFTLFFFFLLILLSLSRASSLLKVKMRPDTFTSPSHSLSLYLPSSPLSSFCLAVVKS